LFGRTILLEAWKIINSKGENLEATLKPLFFLAVMRNRRKENEKVKKKIQAIEKSRLFKQSFSIPPKLLQFRVNEPQRDDDDTLDHTYHFFCVLSDPNSLSDPLSLWIYRYQQWPRTIWLESSPRKDTKWNMKKWKILEQWL